MKYLHIVDGERIIYPYNVEAIRSENPQVSFPSKMPDELLAKFNVYPVLETPRPEANEREYWKEDVPTFSDKAWRQTWKMILIPPPESITRRQCAIELLERKMISSEEALAMTKAGDMPQAIRTIIEKELAESIEAMIRAEIDFAAATYYRDNPLFSMMGMSNTDLDEFFFLAARH